MRNIPIAFVLLFCSVGCHTLRECKEGSQACATDNCPTPTATTATPKVEVQTPETIVVKAPATNLVVEQPCPPQGGPGFGGAPQQNGGPGFGGVPQHPAGPGFGAAPQQPVGPGFGGVGPQMMPMTMVPMQQFGGVPTYGNSEVREKNSIGLMFSSINIPLPWLRLKVIPEGSEVTTRSQIPPANNFGGVPMQGFAPQMQMVGYGAVPMMPMQGFGGVPQQAFGGVPQQSFGGIPQQQFGGTTGSQMVYTGTQMVPVQGVHAVNVPTGHVTVGGGAAGAVGGTGTGFGGVPGGESTADTVEKLKAKLKECEDLQNKLKSLQPSK